MAELATRASALDGHVPSGHIGEPGGVGVEFEIVRDPQLWQLAFWSDSAAAVSTAIALRAGVQAMPRPGRALVSDVAAVLRVEPLKCWLIGCEPPELESAVGAYVDLSHARVLIRVKGEHAATLLMRHLPINLSGKAFAVGSVASSAIHHVGVTVWRAEQDYAVFVPRGFALSIWGLLLESVAQFGATARFD